MQKKIRTDNGYNPKVSPLKQYKALFGVNDLIPVKWFTSSKYKSTDEVYIECIKKGITWRELTGWDADKRKDILL